MKTADLLVKIAFAALLTLGMTLRTAAIAASIELVDNVSIMERQLLDEHHLRLTLALGNRQETLLLTPSSAFHQLHIVDQQGNPTPTATQAYEGFIEGVPTSWARITITSEDVDGVIDTGAQRLFITSKDNSAPERRIAQHAQAFGTYTDKIIFPPAKDRTAQEVVQIPIGTGFDGAADGVTRVARIAIVVDSFYNEALGGRGLAEAISTINTVDGLYQQEFGLALKVDTAIIITDSETLDLQHVSLEDNLERFRQYRMTAPELPPELALVHLFSGVRTDDPSVGLAYIESACRDDGYDVSLSSPFEFPVLLAAHEIGHNLGATHDDETQFFKLSDELLMHSQISNVTTNQFSVCSRNMISTHLELGACYFAAIDLSLTLSREDDTDRVIALITNTDNTKAFPSAKLSIKLKNANIASAPASCNIDTVEAVSCIIPTTLPGDSQSLKFAFRYDETLDNTIDAALEAIGFIDTRTINNYAEIIIPATVENDDTHTIAGNDPDSPATTGAGGEANSGSAGGGGTLGMVLWPVFMVLIALRRFHTGTYSRRSFQASGQ